MSNKQSPRQELRSFVGRGDLRATLDRSANLSPEAMQLLVDIVLRYCEYSPKKKRRS